MKMSKVQFLLFKKLRFGPKHSLNTVTFHHFYGVVALVGFWVANPVCAACTGPFVVAKIEEAATDGEGQGDIVMVTD